jgi:hypothetical protein
VRLWFGDARYDHPTVWPRIHALCRGPLAFLFNDCLPTMKREQKERVGRRTAREYGVTCTPLAQVRACAVVSAATQARRRAEQAAMSALAVRRKVDQQLKALGARAARDGALTRRRKKSEEGLPTNGSEGGRTGAVPAASFVLQFCGVVG